MMMTPEQKIQELVLYFQNLDLEGFSVQEILNLIHIINQENEILGHVLENKTRRKI